MSFKMTTKLTNQFQRRPFAGFTLMVKVLRRKAICGCYLGALIDGGNTSKREKL